MGVSALNKSVLDHQVDGGSWREAECGGCVVRAASGAASVAMPGAVFEFDAA